jgi:hypothetical protein
MSWPIEYFHYMPAPSSMIEMMPGAMKAMTQCAGLKPGENVVIAWDTNKPRVAEALAEFAVGLNPSSRPYATNLEDLGKLGFGHHGIGSNYAIGGEVLAPCHIDGIYSNASLEIDGRLVLDKGTLLIP